MITSIHFFSPFAQAVRNDDIKEIQRLISIGIDEEEQSTALEIALQAGHLEILHYLIFLKKWDASTHFLRCVRDGDAEKVKILRTAGADVNARDLDGVSALILAAEKGHIEVVKVLIAAGADVSHELRNSVEHGRVEVVKVLIAAGADVNARDSDGVTPLIWAARNGHVAVVKLLIAAGADVNAKDIWHRSVWQIVLETLEYTYHDNFDDSVQIVRLLIATGADVSHELRNSAKHGRVAVVKLLLDAGADVNAKDKFNRTASHIAIANRHVEVIQALSEHCSTLAGTICFTQDDEYEAVLKHNPNGRNQKILETKHKLYQALKTANSAIDAQILINAQLLLDVYRDMCIAKKQEEINIVYTETLLQQIIQLVNEDEKKLLSQISEIRPLLTPKQAYSFLFGTHVIGGANSPVKILNQDVLSLIITGDAKSLAERFDKTLLEKMRTIFSIVVTEEQNKPQALSGLCLDTIDMDILRKAKEEVVFEPLMTTEQIAQHNQQAIKNAKKGKWNRVERYMNSLPLDYNAKDHDDNSILFCAVQHRRHDVVQAIINISSQELLPATVRSALEEAIVSGNMNAITVLSPLYKDEDGMIKMFDRIQDKAPINVLQAWCHSATPSKDVIIIIEKWIKTTIDKRHSR